MTIHDLAISEYSNQLIIVIPFDKKNQAEAIAKKVDVNNKSGTFNLGLSNIGKLPATHYWCGWVVTNNQKGILNAITKAANGQIFDGNQVTPDEVLSQLGLQRIITEELLES